ncbi:branched-chain amino acid ABC transporter permease [Herbiconiux ginsengi]|nr:branched-chain amino acid ABC transporter permease [Herbiconiux ginsengi]
MIALIAGLATGAIYALIAIGYNITLTSSGVLNFAFANTLVFGGFVALTATAAGLPLPLTLLISAVVCAVVSALVERGAIRFMPAGSHAELITTLGAATVLTALTAIIWGSDPQRLVLFEQQPFELLGFRVSPIDLILIALPIVFGVAMHLLLNHTRFGLNSRAQAFDREATTLRGVNVRWLSLSAFAIAGIFAGLVGPLVLVSTSASPYLALSLALKGFVVLALGGLGSQVGAIIAGFIIGLIESMVALFVGPFFGDYAVFIVFVLVLLFRSRGLFGNKNLRLV